MTPTGRSPGSFIVDSLAERLAPLGSTLDQGIGRQAGIQNLMGALDTDNREGLFVQKTELDKHTGLVPVDALKGDLAIAEANDNHNRYLDALARRRNTWQHPVHLGGMRERLDQFVH